MAFSNQNLNTHAIEDMKDEGSGAHEDEKAV